MSIIQYWHRREPPSEVNVLINTFRELNPDLRHMLFDEEAADLFIEKNLGKREVEAFRSCAVPAMQSDYFRNCAAWVLGGVHSDADFYCVRPLAPLIEECADGMLFENRRGHIVNGFVVFRDPGHTVMRLALDATTECIERRAGNKVHLVTGPWILNVLREIWRTGSADAVRRMAAGEEHEGVVNTIADVAERDGRLEEAFAGLHIAPLENAWNWIAKPSARPSYKQSNEHWEIWNRQGRDIFR